jgi:general secretion pathway protein F
MEFTYKATDVAGKIFEGAMEGRDERSIAESLQKLGYIPIRISAKQEKGEIKFSLGSYFERITLKDLMLFTQELSTLLEAGLPLDRCLQILPELTEKRRFRDIVRDLLKQIEAGRSFSEALAFYPAVFPKLYVNMTKAGEVGGILNLILVRLGKYLQTSKETKDYIISILIYPSLLAFASGLSIVILLTFVIPRFAKIFADMGQAILFPRRSCHGERVVKGYWWVWSERCRSVVRDPELHQEGGRSRISSSWSWRSSATPSDRQVARFSERWDPDSERGSHSATLQIVMRR